MTTIKDFKLGSDPELFMREAKGKKPYVSAFNLIPGTKKKPHPVAGGFVQHDGMAAEFNIEPAKTPLEFVANNKRVLIELSKLAPTHEFVNIPCVTFSKKVWDSVVKEERELGCEPDLNAYTGEINRPPSDAVDFRTGSGHIHIGWTEGEDIKDEGHKEACMMLIKELDLYLGAPMAWLDGSDAAIKRRELYGKAGAFRIKPYGVEYRVLPNSWVGNDILTEWVFNNARLAFGKLLEGETLAGKFDAKSYINNSKDNYQDIPYQMERLGIPMPKLS
jgi:hypothetical protein